MQNTKIFTIDDCVKDSRYKEDYEGKVIVMKLENFNERYQDGCYQLWLAQHGNGCCPTAKGRMVKATCLYDGECAEWRRENIFGTIKPEVLPDWAKLKLSQMKLHSTVNEHMLTPKYSGYSFLEDGRYIVGVALYDEKEVIEYVELQKSYQHRIMICDSNDFNVLELVKGELIHPSKEALQASKVECLQKQEMKMNL